MCFMFFFVRFDAIMFNFLLFEFELGCVFVLVFVLCFVCFIGFACVCVFPYVSALVCA